MHPRYDGKNMPVKEVLEDIAYACTYVTVAREVPLINTLTVLSKLRGDP